MKEIWKDIKGFEGYYKISNIGRVKKLKRASERGRLTETIKKLTIDANGYYMVGLHKEPIHKTFRVHRLIAIAFISNPENKREINHINGIKLDNSIKNLEWVTCMENITHAIKIGLISQNGENSVRSKLTEKEVLDIRSIKNMSHEKISKLYGVVKTTITAVLARRSWKHI